MKKLTLFIVAGVMTILFASPNITNAGARVYVRIGPPKAKVVKVYRPKRHFKNSVWVSGHYTYKHGKYVWVSGQWVKGKAGYKYVQPHWKHTPRGYYFVPGHWVKR